MAEEFDLFGEEDTDVKTRPSKVEVDEKEFDLFADDDDEEEDEIVEPIPTTDKDKGLKVDEVVANEKFVDRIRDYMIDRKGKQFISMDSDKVVDRFINHMRYFNTNEGFTIDEARYISMADDEKKARAGEAYKIYDKLGNVFVNDGLYGAVDGVFDYLGAIASSPSTYLGFGVGKALTLGAGKLGTQAVKKMASDAVRKTLKEAAEKGLSKEARNELVMKAKDDIIHKAVIGRTKRNVGITGALDASVAGGQDYMLQTDVLMESEAQEVYSPLQTGLSMLGSGLGTGLSIYSIPKITGADKRGTSGNIVEKIEKANKVKQTEIKDEKLRQQLNKKYLSQLKKNAEKLDTETPTEFEIVLKSKKAELKTAKSALDKANRRIGQLKRLKNPTKKHLEELEKLKERVKPNSNLKKSGVDNDLVKDVKRLEADVKKFEKSKVKAPISYEGFPELVAEGKKLNEVPLDASVIKFLLGKSEDSPLEKNIVELAEEAGAKFRANMNAAQKFALSFKYLDQEVIDEVSDLTKEKFGIWLGDALDTSVNATTIGHRIALSASTAGEILESFKLVQNKQDKALVKGYADALKEGKITADDIAKEVEAETRFGRTALPKGNKVGYAQNVWKRLLVSAPSTTAANVYGFGQYYLANSVAEVLQGGVYFLTGDVAKSKALFDLQVRKFKNLVDPYSTLDTFNALLKTDDAFGKFLTETIAGGVQKAQNRYGFPEGDKLLNNIEKTTKAAQAISLVNMQDSLTKSQMLVNSIDKYLRLQKNKTFDQVLEEGNLVDIDQDVMDRALGETLRSVFAEDYTQSKTFGGLAGNLAKVVETASNSPGIGFVLPFGRFMNNVVATAYQWNPVTGGMEMAAALMSNRPDKKLRATEAFSRATVGGAALAYAMDFQEEQQKKGYAYNELDTGTGEVTDITNVFPLSLLMIAGRVGMKMRNGETVDRDLANEFGKQIAIGQAATDLQFGNDISRILTLAFNEDPEFKGNTLPTLLEGLSYTSGNIVAGATRPLDVINKTFGYALAEVSPYDVTPQVDKRLAKGAGEKFGYNATKYVDNIIEGVASVVNGKTVLLGDELRVAAREGSIFDPSPYRTFTGQRIKQARTNANIVFGMVDKPEWKTGLYTGVPEYDRVANKIIAPLIEQESEMLLKDESFINGDGDFKRNKVNKMLTEVKSRVNNYLSAIPESEAGLNYRKKKLLNQKKYYVKKARDIIGVEGTSIRDLTEKQVDKLESTIEYLRALDKR